MVLLGTRGSRVPCSVCSSSTLWNELSTRLEFVSHQKTLMILSGPQFRKNIYICTYFHRSLLGFSLVAPHLLTILIWVLPSMVCLLNNWGHVAQPLLPAAWSPEQGSPSSAHPPRQQCWRSDSPEIQEQAPLPPVNWLFSSARSVPQNGSLTGCRNSCAGPEERLTQAQRWYPSSFISPISQIRKWWHLPDLPVGGKACACSQESLFSHFCKEQPKHQPTTKHFSTCFIVYKYHVQQEIAHYFAPFSIDLGLSLIKCNVYLGL